MDVDVEESLRDVLARACLTGYEEGKRFAAGLSRPALEGLFIKLAMSEEGSKRLRHAIDDWKKESGYEPNIDEPAGD